MDERYKRIVRNEEFNRLLDKIEALEADRIYCRHGLGTCWTWREFLTFRCWKADWIMTKTSSMPLRSSTISEGPPSTEAPVPTMRPVRPLRKEFFETADMRNRKFR